MAVCFDKIQLRKLAKERGLSVCETLRRSGVSRNAYYNLLRKRSLLPKSVELLSETLGVDSEELVMSDTSQETRMARKMLFVQKLVEEDPRIDSGTALTTLKLLEMTSLERLEQSIRYGTAAACF